MYICFGIVYMMLMMTFYNPYMHSITNCDVIYVNPHRVDVFYVRWRVSTLVLFIVSANYNYVICAFAIAYGAPSKYAHLWPSLLSLTNQWIIHIHRRYVWTHFIYIYSTYAPCVCCAYGLCDWVFKLRCRSNYEVRTALPGRVWWVCMWWIRRLIVPFLTRTVRLVCSTQF